MTDKQPCSLRSLQVQVQELEKQLNLHVQYQHRAVEKANSELRERLEGMNEFRDTLRDQATRFVTREECEITERQTQKILQQHQDLLQNWQGRIFVGGIVIAAASSLIAVMVTAWIGI